MNIIQKSINYFTGQNTVYNAKLGDHELINFEKMVIKNENKFIRTEIIPMKNKVNLFINVLIIILIPRIYAKRAASFKKKLISE